jgi:hypothetical protein
VATRAAGDLGRAAVGLASTRPSAAAVNRRPTWLEMTGMDGCSLARQLTRGLPGVYEAVISGHREPPPVQKVRLGHAPEVTGDGTTRRVPITRNEGVPGSSPGVGSKSPAERQLLLPLWATRSTSLLLTNSGVGTICREFLPVKVLTTAQELLGPAEQGRSRCAYGLASAGASFSTYQKSCKPLSS